MRDRMDEIMSEVEPVILRYCRYCREESGEPCNVPECAAYGRMGPRMLHAIVMDEANAKLYAETLEDDDDGWRASL